MLYPPLNSVRSTDRFHTYLSLSVSSRQPLLTLWTASWCPTCRTIAPAIRALIESGVGEAEGGVAYAPVEFDAPDAAGLAMTYMITAVPTLLAFDDRGEPARGAGAAPGRIADGRRLADRDFLAEWIREQARKYSGGGGGGGGGGRSAFGGLFGR